METELTTYLLAQSGLTALIGRRFSFDVNPEDTSLPRVAAICVDNVPLHTHQGQLDTEQPNYQFTAYASKRAGAAAVAEQLKVALKDYHGTLSDLTVQWMTLINEIPGTETSGDGTIEVSTVDLEFQIVYNNT